MALHPSHEQEQALVRVFLGGETFGTFVEVGANHPTQGSQKWHLDEASWTGVLVEPQPELAAILAALRKARVFAVACSSPDDAGQSLPLRVDGPWSTLDRDCMALGLNGWYVPENDDAVIAFADRWEILHKYCLALPFRKMRNASRRASADSMRIGGLGASMLASAGTFNCRD